MKNHSLNDVCSNLSRYFELQRHLDNHTKRLKNVQPTLRLAKQNLSKSNPHIKKQPLAQFNRIMTIDIQNKALLKKLTDKSPSRIGKQRPYKIIKNNIRRNMQKCKQKLQNEGLMRRIKLAKSSYQNMRFECERRVTQRYINTISKFGYKNFTPNKTIIFPFYKRKKLQSKIKQDSNHKEPNLVKIQNKQVSKSVENTESNAQIDTIIKIDRKQWQKEGINAHITYIQWTKKFTIQINTGVQQSVNLTIPKEIYIQHFNRCWMTLHENIRYNKNDKIFYLDLYQAQN